MMLAPEDQILDFEVADEHMDALHQDWQPRAVFVSGGKSKCEWIRRRFPLFSSRLAAWSFVDKVAQAGANMDHDAEINWCYKSVTLTLTTHHAGGYVTSRDIELAKKIDEIYKKVPK